jgi:hypothetical protein
MWRPWGLGKAVAERRLRLVGPRRRAAIVTVRFGRPVRAPRPERGDPWWCPVEIEGLGKRRFNPIAGEDSLQALVLALEFVTQVLPLEAERAGAQVEWLGERERLVFANTLSSGLAARALQNMVDGLAAAVNLLEDGHSRGSAASKKLVPQLRTLIASGGYTCDPRRLPQPSNTALQPTSRARRKAKLRKRSSAARD